MLSFNLKPDICFKTAYSLKTQEALWFINHFGLIDPECIKGHPLIIKTLCHFRNPEVDPCIELLGSDQSLNPYQYQHGKVLDIGESVWKPLM